MLCISVFEPLTSLIFGLGNDLVAYRIHVAESEDFSRKMVKIRN